MNLHNFGVFVFVWLLCLFREPIFINKSVAVARGFLIYRTTLTTQRSCNCSMSFACSCCQSVIILYTKKEKDLCVNFAYQRNGLNVDVALSSDMINSRTITNYKAFQFCVSVPGCLFSTACINILELNQFPRSITICLRLDIYAKKQLWQINYDCINLSTELPIISANSTTRMMDMTSREMPTMENGQTGGSSVESTMASTQMTTIEMSEMSTAEMTEQADDQDDENEFETTGTAN